MFGPVPNVQGAWGGGSPYPEKKPGLMGMLPGILQHIGGAMQGQRAPSMAQGMNPQAVQIALQLMRAGRLDGAGNLINPSPGYAGGQFGLPRGQ